MECELYLKLLESALKTAEASVRSLMQHQKLRWNYETGFMLEALFEAAELTNRNDLRGLAAECVDYLIDANGNIAGYTKEEYNLDQIESGKTLYRMIGDRAGQKYENALHMLMSQLESHPRTQCGSFWHKKIYPWQIWLDGLYMFGPWYAKYSRLFGKPELMEDLHTQIRNIRQHLRDEQLGLYFHGWDESVQQLWANPKTGQSPCFWARAMGWLTMALIDIWEIAGGSISWGTELSLMIIELAASICRYQDLSGIWYQVLDRAGENGNYLEASASAMFAYFLAKAIRLGILPEIPYAIAHDNAMEGLVSKLTYEDEQGKLHVAGICKVAGLGGSPYRDGSFSYYCSEPVVVDDFKGLAAMIIAIVESMKLKGVKVLNNLSMGH